MTSKPRSASVAESGVAWNRRSRTDSLVASLIRGVPNCSRTQLTTQLEEMVSAGNTCMVIRQNIFDASSTSSLLDYVCAGRGCPVSDDETRSSDICYTHPFTQLPVMPPDGLRSAAPPSLLIGFPLTPPTPSVHLQRKHLLLPLNA